MAKKQTKVVSTGNIVISFKSGGSLVIRGYGGLSHPGISTLVSAFSTQVRTGNASTYERVTIPQSSSGTPPSEVAIRLADVSGIAYVPDP